MIAPKTREQKILAKALGHRVEVVMDEGREKVKKENIKEKERRAEQKPSITEDSPERDRFLHYERTGQLIGAPFEEMKHKSLEELKSMNEMGFTPSEIANLRTSNPKKYSDLVRSVAKLNIVEDSESEDSPGYWGGKKVLSSMNEKPTKEDEEGFEEPEEEPEEIEEDDKMTNEGEIKCPECEEPLTLMNNDEYRCLECGH